MNATIEVEFEIDGECPPPSVLESAIRGLISGDIILSEKVDGSDDWALLVKSAAVSVLRPTGGDTCA